MGPNPQIVPEQKIKALPEQKSEAVPKLTPEMQQKLQGKDKELEKSKPTAMRLPSEGATFFLLDTKFRVEKSSGLRFKAIAIGKK